MLRSCCRAVNRSVRLKLTRHRLVRLVWAARHVPPTASCCLSAAAAAAAACEQGGQRAVDPLILCSVADQQRSLDAERQVACSCRGLQQVELLVTPQSPCSLAVPRGGGFLEGDRSTVTCPLNLAGHHWHPCTSERQSASPTAWAATTTLPPPQPCQTLLTWGLSSLPRTSSRPVQRSEMIMAPLCSSTPQRWPAWRR